MDVRKYEARFMVHKVTSFSQKERVLCFSQSGFSTYDPDSQQLTNTWSYDDVDNATTLEGETDFVIFTPRHRIKRTMYRCHYRMEVLVCLMRLRSRHQTLKGRPVRPELQAYPFPCVKFHTRGLQSPCVVEIGPDGVYQRDEDGELTSHIPYTSLVSIDLVCDDHNAIVLNHSDNSSLFVVEKRTEMAQAIHRVMRAYGMEINEYRKKTMEAALKGDAAPANADEIAFQYPVTRVSSTNKQLSARVLAVSERFIAELGENDVVISSRPLSRIFSLILFADSKDAFEIVFVDGIRRTFYSTHREKLVTELLTSCHALKNMQVDVVTDRMPDSMRMVPCKIIQSEGGKLLHKSSNELNVRDRELRVVQTSLLQQIVSHGSSKTTRTQRQLPMGIDDGMHGLAREFNANTPTTGVIAQPSKPFDRAAFFVAREIRDVVSRHGPRHAFLSTYLQTLYRLLQAPPAMKEFVGILLERGDGYLSVINEILTGRSPVIVYWAFMVLHRLLESKVHKIQCREIFLTSSSFLSSTLSLFDLNPKTQRYLSDLPVMKLSQFVLCLLKTNPGRQLELSKALHEQLGRRFRMLHRILFGFPGLATVEACVGILARMTGNPSSVYVEGEDVLESSASSLLAAQAVQPPPLSMGFGEHLTFENSGATNRNMSSRRAAAARMGNFRSSRMASSGPRSTRSAASENGHGIVVQNPEVLLRQYRLFLESPCGAKKIAMADYSDSMYLRLRYRCRNVFLQELMSHLVGSFDDFKRAFDVDCFQFSGFLGKTSGQREKSDLYLTPRALIAVRVMNRNTSEFEYRSIKRVFLPSENRDAFAFSIKDKYLYVYSDSRAQIVAKMHELAGVVGLPMELENVSELPKPHQPKQDPHRASTTMNWDPASTLAVVKRGGRHGFFRFRKKQILVINGMLFEADPETLKEKAYSLKDLLRVVRVESPHADHPELPIMIAVEFFGGARVAYLSNNESCLLAKLYDGCLYCQNTSVMLNQAFSRVNPRLTSQGLLQHESEKSQVLDKEGMFAAMYREVSKDFEKLTSTDGTSAVTSNLAAYDKALFGLENLNFNVEHEDFGSNAVDPRIAQLSFRSLFQGLVTMLQLASKPPIRVNDVAIILEAFCRVNDGCYRLASDGTRERLADFVERMVLIIGSGEQISTLWAIKALHSLAVGMRRAPSHKQAEQSVRGLVIGNDKVVYALMGVLDRNQHPLCTLAVLDFLYDVAIRSRQNTDNNHFDMIVKQLSSTSSMLQRLSSQMSVVGLAVLSTGLLKVTLENADAKSHERMCDNALASGLVMRSLFNAFFFPSSVGRMTYRYVAGMWIVHHKSSFELLQRMLPHGFIRMIAVPAMKNVLHAAYEQEHKRFKEPKARKHRDGGAGGSDWFIRRMRQEISAYLPDSLSSRAVRVRPNYTGESAGDIAILANLLQQDFFLLDLIWNARSREELKTAMERTMDLIENKLSSKAGDGLAFGWNHVQFRVTYPSLVPEVQIENVFVRVLVARVRDGSLKLSDAAKEWEALADNGRASISEAGHLLQSTSVIMAAPKTFYNEIYQRWLELRLLGKGAGDNAAESELPQLRTSELVTQSPMEAGDLLMKALIEVAKAFPSVRSVPAYRVHFLMELVIKSFETQEIYDLIELLSHLSADPATTTHLTNDLHVSTILFLAVLSHRRIPTPRGALHAAVGEDGDEFPVVGLDIVPEYDSVSSIPMTHLSNNSRLSLRWMCKSVGVPDREAVGVLSPIELHQHLLSQATPLQDVFVCCCTVHKKHDSDDHEWRRLHQVPELRWLELMSEPISAATVGLKALRILRNLVVNELGGSDNLVPLSMGKQLLSSKDKVAHVVQLLLVDDATVRKLACEILMSLGPVVGSKLHEYGMFFFVFAVDHVDSDLDQDHFVEQARLLQRFHRVQDSREARVGQSFLIDMLPEPLIGLLDSEESPGAFAAVFSGRSADSRVIWTPSMRKHLRMMIREHIEEFEDDLKRDVAATYRYVSLPSVKYSELSRDIYCGGVFLSSIAQGDEASLDAIEEPQFLMSAIEDKWKSLQQRQTTSTLSGVKVENGTAFKTFGWPQGKLFNMSELRMRYRDLCKKGAAVSTVRAAYESLCSLLERQLEVNKGKTSDDVVECILQAQRRLLKKFNFQFFSYESRAIPLLLDTIALSAPPTEDVDEDDLDIGDLCVMVLYELLSSAPLNVAILISIEGAWDVVLGMADQYGRAGSLSTKRAAFGIVHIMVTSEVGPRSLLRNTAEVSSVRRPPPMRLESDTSEDTMGADSNNPLFADAAFHSQAHLMVTTQSARLCKLLAYLLTTIEERQPWQIQKLLFGIVTAMCASRHLQEQLVLSTNLFWRALYLLLSTAEDVARGPASNLSMDDGAVALKERDVVEAAFLALRALSIGLNGKSKSHGLDALANLLPLEFLDCLDRPSGHDFWMILSTEIREPTCIWNDDTRSELMQLISEHCRHQDDDELLFLESATSYMYDCLTTEPLVGGIYLRILLEKAETDQEAITPECLYPLTAREFIEALFTFLHENRDPTIGMYGDTLPVLQSLNVLVDLPVFKEAVVEALDEFCDVEDMESEAVSVATLGKYLLPFDRSHNGAVSISSRRSLSSYGFMSRNGREPDLDGLPPGMEAEFGNVDYLNRQEFALLILNKICGLEYDLDRIFKPFRQFTWSLQVIADHLDYEQAYYALSCLAELCDTCLVVAEYVQQSGLWVEILGIAIQSRQHVLHDHFLRAEALREPAFEVIFALLIKDFTIREEMYSGLGRFLPYPIVYQIHLDPSMAAKFFDDNHEKSDLIWNTHWRTAVRSKVDEVICRNRVERSRVKRDTVELYEEDYVHMPENFIAGLYLDNFLARPDPEDLTNAAYNLELLFQQWKEKQYCLMGFDLENPPQFLRDLAAEVENLTTAMSHILRAPLALEESIDGFDMPLDVVRLVRHCNKHVIAGFPYRCTLRVARQLANFPVMQSKNFLELLFCRITVDHPDIPVLVKLVRRVLEARSQAGASDEPFLLKDLAYFSTMLTYLEGVVEKKDSVDAKVLSNMNRILRIIKAEQRDENREVTPESQSIFQRSARWYNSTLMEARSRLQRPSIQDDVSVNHDADVPQSFDVDAEHSPRASTIGTFNVDDARADMILEDVPMPPRSYFDGETIQKMAPAPASFRYVNGSDDTESSLPAARASMIRATYEPIDSQYHSSKAAQYDRQDEEADHSRRTSLTNIAAMDTEAPVAQANPPRAVPQPSLDDRESTISRSSFFTAFDSEMGARRLSIMESWRGPTSNQLNPLLSSMTMSRRGRRKTANDSRRQTYLSSKKWFGSSKQG